MAHIRTRTLSCALLATVLFPAAALAKPAFDPLYADHAVLQRGKPIVVSGRGDPGEKITVTLGDASAAATADAGGRWSATLPARAASSSPLVLKAASAAGEASAQDILIGDVWLCSGQSNMEWSLSQATGAGFVIAGSKDDQLRLLVVPKASAPAPARDFGKPVAWAAAGPDSAPGFSGVCYYMVRKLRETQKVPIGAINASWGGTQIRAWLDPEGSRAIYGDKEAVLLKQFGTDPTGAVAGFAPRWESWWREASGDKAGQEPWAMPVALSWKPVPAIAYWESWPGGALKGFDGMLWFRRTVTLTAAQAKQGATLSLGVLDELDQTWVNGKAVGNSFGWDYARNYKLPAPYLHAGANEIIVALTDTYGNGGMQGPADKLSITFGDGSKIPLGDGWLYSVAKVQTAPPRSPWDANAGLGLIYNGMIAPMGAYGLTGVAWYQGESDVGVPGYSDRLAAMFKGWRGQFGNANLPMLIVSLPNYGPIATKPVDSGWAATREQQRRAVAADGHAGLATTLDVGDRSNLHPPGKQPVGDRLAYAAETLAYSAAHSANGPEIASAKVGKMSGVLATYALRFKGVTGALHSWSGAPIGFELCGDSQESCRYAAASAAGDTVTLIGDGKPATRVRYAWADSPIVNLYDEAELPVGTFEVPIAP
ncbi:MAG: sialate O-acetylesterase [Sphingobium sp.]|nr:sialate O-acetylesterase [Sphingobium sp.]